MFVKDGIGWGQGSGLGWEGSSGTPCGLSQKISLPLLQATHTGPCRHEWALCVGGSDSPRTLNF